MLKDTSKQDAAENALSLTKLSKPTRCDSMSSIPLAFAYSYASAAAYTIAEKHGAARRCCACSPPSTARRSAASRDASLTDKVLRRTLKTSLKSLEDEIEAYARRTRSSSAPY